MTSVPLNPHCRVTDSPPCESLLREPEAVLGDRNRWPSHICMDVARHSTMRWANALAQQRLGTPTPTPADVDAWVELWPLPVAPLSMPGFWRPHELGPPDVPWREQTNFRQLAVLPLLGKAGLILQPNIPFVHVAAFGIVDDHPALSLASNRDIAYGLVDMQFTLAGWQDERVRAFCDAAVSWWDWYRRVRRPGRPSGALEWSSGRIEHALLAFVAETGNRSPQQKQFIDWGASRDNAPRRSPSRGTLATFLRDVTHMDWRTWRSAVLTRNGID